ncbi:hypothetical protein HL653_06020 [Sphingomonas sp. AP4-R1]|uniref:hypothetical protein n=1 Tax=Sphingomonas sp. AP4-R1 TaxID=2735134 RepID=UPI001493A1C8|nr:hypothetical protein [Sphingomonas sp. AP4-R1]QJU57406.1 hypothetical protein HL653_06020 [Sphingomonas sp. AP4-R1]
MLTLAIKAEWERKAGLPILANPKTSDCLSNRVGSGVSIARPASIYLCEVVAFESVVGFDPTSLMKRLASWNHFFRKTSKEFLAMWRLPVSTPNISRS